MLNNPIDLMRLRVDQNGSLVAPQSLRDAFERQARAEMNDAELRAIEDEAIVDVVRKQEAIGWPIVTDGEFRRRNFQESFSAAVSGFDVPDHVERLKDWREPNRPLHRTEQNFDAQGPAITTRRPALERLRLERNVVLEEYRFTAGFAQNPVKVSLIGPDRISQRFAWERSQAVYRDIDEFIADVVAIERQMVSQLVDAGCRYVHIDAPGFTAYVDDVTMAQMRARGEDPMQNFAQSLKAEAAVIANYPGVTFGIHLCRGNQRSMWHREGTYDAIAERLFNELPHDRFLLEYDTPRAGSFAPLRFVPKGRVVVLGLVSTKVAELETVDALNRRIDEASKFLPLDQLAISPQCGFASDVVGNLLSADDQKRKLEIVVETARQVWG